MFSRHGTKLLVSALTALRDILNVGKNILKFSENFREKSCDDITNYTNKVILQVFDICSA